MWSWHRVLLGGEPKIRLLHRQPGLTKKSTPGEFVFGVGIWYISGAQPGLFQRRQVTKEDCKRALGRIVWVGDSAPGEMSKEAT